MDRIGGGCAGRDRKDGKGIFSRALDIAMFKMPNPGVLELERCLS